MLDKFGEKGVTLESYMDYLKDELKSNENMDASWTVRSLGSNEDGTKAQ